jgi:aspartate aminotransferase
MLAPATGFYSVPERGLQEVRISYVLNVDDMKRSMELLKKAIEVYPGRK